MKRSPWTIFAAVVFVGVTLSLQSEETQPLVPYRPPVNATSTLRIWGSGHMAGIVQAWADAYRSAHPEITFAITLLGNGSAMPALYLGRADIAFFSRDLIVTDRDGFNHVMKYDPLRIELGTGSLDRPGHSPALVLLVNRDNPLSQLTLSEVDAIFSSRRRRGAVAALRTWGDVGLTGEWAGQPIRIYADDTQSMTALFFQRVALGDSRRMNWANFTEFSDTRDADGKLVEAAARSAAAVSIDRYGLAVSTMCYCTPATKAIALSGRAGDPAVFPTLATVAARTYPLSRPIFACASRAPGQPLDSKVRDFLGFLVSREGQRIMTTNGDYFPLDDIAVEREREKLLK